MACSDCSLSRAVCSWSMLDISRRTKDRYVVCEPMCVLGKDRLKSSMSPRTQYVVKSRHDAVESEGNQPCSVSSYTVHIHCETCCESCGDGRLVMPLECWRPSYKDRSNYCMELRVGRRTTLLFAFDLEIMEPERGPDSRYCLVRNCMYM